MRGRSEDRFQTLGREVSIRPSFQLHHGCLIQLGTHSGQQLAKTPYQHPGQHPGCSKQRPYLKPRLHFFLNPRLLNR